MKFLIAAWYEFLKNLRDVKMLGFMVVFPVVVSYLIGSAVSGYFKPDNGKPIAVACVNLDEGAAGSGFDQFIHNDEIEKRIQTSVYGRLEDAQKALETGDCSVLVYLPAGLSDQALKGEGGNIQIYGETDAELVKTLAESFAGTFNANLSVVKTGGMPVQAERREAVIRVDRTNGAGYPRLTDYYSVLVLLEALVIGSIFGAYITARQYGSDIHIRIHSLPVNEWTLTFGRMTGSVAYLLLTSLATIVFTKYFYGVNWGGNIPVLFGTLAVFGFTVVGMGVICGRILKKVSTSFMAVFVLMFFFGTVSGSVSPRSGVITLGFITPNYYAKVLLFGSIYGYPAQTMITNALWLLGFAAAVCLAVVLLTRRVRQ
jgi:ABC-2 type transport system permease protein